ncbi:molybdopterin-synthase adenylyltransferase MoeB [Thalassiella azotivora]
MEPAAALTPQEVTRYSRHLLLPDVGEVGQRRLKNARVLVVGAGGLGAPSITYLAAAGVGTIGVVDDDVVDTSNLQRQVIHGVADVGRPKVRSAAEAVAALNPLVRVVEHDERLTADNALDLVGGYDLVLDGADNFGTRYLVSDACEVLDVPEVWASVLRFDAQVSVFWRRYGPTYRDLFPEPPAPGTVPSCAEGGVLGAMVGTVGSLMATEAVKLVTGAGEPLIGRLLVLDALGTTWRELRVRPTPGRSPVTSVVDVDAACAVPAADGSGGALPSGGGAQQAVPEVGAAELAALLAERDAGSRSFVLVDVRTEQERSVVSVPGAVHVPLDRVLAGDVDGLAPGDDVVLHCKSGGRSEQAGRALLARGFRRVSHLRGGVLAWVDEVDPTLPRY